MLQGNRTQILAVDSNGVDVSLIIEGYFDRTTGALRGDCLQRLLYIIAPLDLRTCPNLSFSRLAILLRFIQTRRAQNQPALRFFQQPLDLNARI